METTILAAVAIVALIAGAIAVLPVLLIPNHEHGPNQGWSRHSRRSPHRRASDRTAGHRTHTPPPIWIPWVEDGERGRSDAA